MTLSQLHYVITAAEAGSFNRAAEILYMAQPSLTAAVKELEKELGITVFNRSGKGVTLTPDGQEFLLYAREVYGQYEAVLEKYGRTGNRKKKFGVSAQHYSFAVKAFVETVKRYDMSKYEFAIRETRTLEVITDVSSMRSEIGILYLSDFNRRALTKLFRANGLEFSPLIRCSSFVYVHRQHPLASCSSVGFSDLGDYPCLSFEQGEEASFYFAEEVFSTHEYPREIKVCDRATVLNLMVGLNGYIICPGIICEELNGDDYVAVPYKPDADSASGVMEIGYITRKNTILSRTAELYVRELKNYLENNAEGVID